MPTLTGLVDVISIGIRETISKGMGGEEEENELDRALGDYRDGTRTRAVAIRASSGTFINVYAHETGNHISVI